MSATETGWTRPRADGVYWWRLNPADTPDAVIVKGDVFYDFAESEPTAITLGEFLGPFTASDFEQLIQLRKAASLFDEVVRDLEMRTCYGCNNRIGWNETPTKYGDWTKCSSCRNARALLKQVAALREALASTEEKS